MCSKTHLLSINLGLENTSVITRERLGVSFSSEINNDYKFFNKVLSARSVFIPYYSNQVLFLFASSACNAPPTLLKLGNSYSSFKIQLQCHSLVEAFLNMAGRAPSLLPQLTASNPVFITVQWVYIFGLVLPPRRELGERTPPLLLPPRPPPGVDRPAFDTR